MNRYFISDELLWAHPDGDWVRYQEALEEIEKTRDEAEASAAEAWRAYGLLCLEEKK